MDFRHTGTDSKEFIVLLRTGPKSFLFKLFLALCGATAFVVLNASSVSPSERAYQVCVKARQTYSQNEANTTNALDLARAIFEYAEFAGTDSERADLAQEGIAVARKATELDGQSAEAHYYLAMNLGQLARTKSLGALKIVREMEREFLRAIEIDPRVDYAGPERSLGELYLEAPGSPTSIGSKSKARMRLENAVKLAPEFPDNHLLLMQAYLKTKDKNALEKEMDHYRKDVIIKAKKTFTGEKWQAAWQDWQKRWTELQEKAEKLD
jgi:tetratricopeptide (TPR) repeat protein